MTEYDTAMTASISINVHPQRRWRMLRCLHWTVILGAFVAVSRPVAAESAVGQRPNVVVILADDAGWGDFSFVGNTNLETPAIDSLARDGATLRQFMVQPVCAPTRAELLTGRYHPRSGVRGVSLGQERMDPAERTIANVFRDAGYATGCFGKWHNGTQWPHHPRARGFDTFYGFTEGHWGSYFNAPLEHDGRFMRGTGYVADDIAARAADFIAASAGQSRPFFCLLAFNTPHSPMCVPDDAWTRFQDRPIGLRGPDGEREDLPFTRAALAMVENLDQNVGRLLATLDRLDLASDTIVVFLSDNGPNSGRWCGGMRGRKGSTDDGGVRSVCSLRWPQRIGAGTSLAEVTGAIDIMPTLAGLAGIDVRAARPLDGVDLAPLLRGNPAAPTLAKAAADRGIVSSFGGKVSVRTTRHRLDAEGRLYDMQADPGQTRDLAAENPDITARLGRMAAEWRRDVLQAVEPPAEERFVVGYPGAPSTELPARDGVARGGIVRSGKAPNCSFFTHWTRPDDAITWAIDVLTPGKYDAELWYTCPVADAGAKVELACRQATVMARISPGWDPPLNRGEDRVERTAEGYDKDFRPLRLGTIELAAGPATLSLRAIGIPGATVADVRRIVLVPSAE